MAIGSELEKKLSKQYEPSASLDFTFKGNDVTILTNNQGEAITLFIGKRKSNGAITGERYTRRLVKDESGKLVKSHWDNKGKVSNFIS